MQTIPKELIRNADQLSSKEAILVLFYYRENKSRRYERIKEELRNIGVLLKLETLKREIRIMRERGLMTYKELERGEGQRGSRPRAYSLSERGKIMAEEEVKVILERLG